MERKKLRDYLLLGSALLAVWFLLSNIGAAVGFVQKLWLILSPFILGAALAFAHQRADVAIVSSANLGAVLEEWEMYGLLEHTDIVLAQNAGSKAFCIAELLKKEYAPDHVLMCGDAPGDKQAAEKNGVFYYPILVRNEKASWEEFIAEGFDRLLAGTYAGAYQAKKNEQFLRNLGA